MVHTAPLLEPGEVEWKLEKKKKKNFHQLGQNISTVWRAKKNKQTIIIKKQTTINETTTFMLMLASVVTDAADKIGFNSPSETTQRSADTYWCKLDECSEIKKRVNGGSFKKRKRL